ncbi:MAG: hypothetical protein ACI4HL_02830 [Ruminococcus sp.]
MKKLVSAVLTFAMLITMFVVPVTATSAATKKIPETYIATNQGYGVKNGTVFSLSKGTLQYRTNKGKTTTLAKFSDTYSCKYYVRSNIVYYNTNTGTSSYLMQVGLNGKNKKKLYSGKSNGVLLLGGYGSSVIFQSGEKICKYKGGKVTTLIKSEDAVLFYGYNQIFNGKIYYGNKCYDLATGKTKTFKAQYYFATDNYLYYIDNSMNLKRLDKSGKSKTVATKITNLSLVDGATVIYSKTNSSKKEVFYKRTGVKNKAVKLCTWDDIYNRFTNKDGTKSSTEHDVKAYVVGGKVYMSAIILGEVNYDEDVDSLFNMRQALFSVSAKGGTPKKVYECKDYDGLRAMKINNKFEYKVVKNIFKVDFSNFNEFIYFIM